METRLNFDNSCTFKELRFHSSCQSDLVTEFHVIPHLLCENAHRIYCARICIEAYHPLRRRMLDVELTKLLSRAALVVLPVSRLRNSPFAVAYDLHDTMFDARNICPQIK